MHGNYRFQNIESIATVIINARIDTANPENKDFQNII